MILRPTIRRSVICALALLALPSLGSARLRAERERLRDEAQHACYGDAQRLCSDAIPNEARVKACMTRQKTRLSPACRKFFDRGVRG